MTRRSFDPSEIDQPDAGLELMTSALERYADATADDPTPGLADRVMARVEAEPIPKRSLLAMLAGAFAPDARFAGPARAVVVAGTMALAVVAVVVAGQLAGLFTPDQVGPSPSPSEVILPSPTPTPTPTPSPQPTSSPTMSPSPSPSDERSPEPTDDETPEPSDDDNSGPGGGGGDDDDNSGPGGGGSGEDRD